MEELEPVTSIYYSPDSEAGDDQETNRQQGAGRSQLKGFKEVHLSTQRHKRHPSVSHVGDTWLPPIPTSLPRTHSPSSLLIGPRIPEQGSSRHGFGEGTPYAKTLGEEKNSLVVPSVSLLLSWWVLEHDYMSSLHFYCYEETLQPRELGEESIGGV